MSPCHVAFRPKSEAQVDAFYEAAMDAETPSYARLLCRLVRTAKTFRPCIIPNMNVSKFINISRLPKIITVNLYLELLLRLHESV